MRQGWWAPHPKKSGKLHYVGKDGRSLCKKWIYSSLTSSLIKRDPNSDYICQKCFDSKAKLNA
jgi:hypothetical protein